MLVLNKQDTNPHIKLGEAVAQYAAELQNLRLLPVRIGYRVAYRRSLAEGMGVGEMPQKDPRAIQEIETLYTEVFKP